MERQTLYVLGGLLVVHAVAMLLGALGARPGSPSLKHQLLRLCVPAGAVCTVALVFALSAAKAHWYVALLELLVAAAMMLGMLLAMFGTGRSLALTGQRWPALVRRLVLVLAWAGLVPVQLAIWALAFLVGAASGCSPGAYECPV